MFTQEERDQKNICPCCGIYLHDTLPGWDDVCRICKWEDNGLQRKQPDYIGAANDMSLNQARALFEKGKDKRGNTIRIPLMPKAASQGDVRVLATGAIVEAGKGIAFQILDVEVEDVVK